MEVEFPFFSHNNEHSEKSEIESHPIGFVALSFSFFVG